MFGLHDIFGELAILLLVAALAGVAAVRLRQPLVLVFIAVGIIAGPSGLRWIRSTDQIHVLAEMGLALLLFVVGLRLDLHIIRTMGAVAVTIGLGQVLLTAAVGFLLVTGLDMPPVTALYIALALTFSSTVIIVKLLSDKRETESLQGRLMLGILIVQDLVVVLAMIALSTFTDAKTGQPAMYALRMVAEGAALLGGMWIATFLLLPRLLPLLARSTELLVLFAIAWALILAQVGDVLGFGKEVGAFLAGISLASTAYREIIAAKLVSLRDFLLLFFFIELGSQLDVATLGGGVLVSLVLAAFVLLVKPVLVMLIMGWMGYRKRTGFMAGLYTAQISEFSLILMAMGASAGHLSQQTVGIVTLVGLITIGLSSHFIQHAQGLYDHLAPYLRVFDRNLRHREDTSSAVTLPGTGTDMLLFGIGTYGSSIAGHLQAHNRRVLGVDFDPQAVNRWNARGWPAVFGDVEDPDFAASLPLAQARWVVSSIRETQANVALIRAVRHAGYTGKIAFAAHDREAGQVLLDISPGLLLVPFEDAAAQAVDLLFVTEQRIARETMDKLIETITDHYVVCGYGRMGQQIVKDLRQQGVPFVVVEDNPEQVPRLVEQSVPHVVGKASQDDILLKSGIARAKGLIAVASTDEENVFIVLTARGINPRLDIVARSIREENEDKLRRAGANRVMSPYILGGRRMAAAVTRPGVLDFLDLIVHNDGLDTDIGYVTVPPGAACEDVSLQKVDLWHACGTTILAVQRPGEALYANPGPEFVVREGDELIVMGSQTQIAAARSHLAQRTVNAPHSGSMS